MTNKPDDLNAVREIAKILEPFASEERDRIFRWTREKLGMTHHEASPMSTPQVTATPAMGSTIVPSASLTVATPPRTVDIKQFKELKQPRSDVQFATVVAYFYMFEAPKDQRKDEIDKNVLVEACRQAGHRRPPHPIVTLNNATRLGFLDRGSKKGAFAINSVGENLVAMALPDGGGETKSTKKSEARHKKNRYSNKTTSRRRKR